METYKIIYYQNGQIRHPFIVRSLSKDRANQEWNDFKETEEIYRGKITIHWKGTESQWNEIIQQRNRKR